MAANPEAIAWYLKRSEDLLVDLRDQVQSLRTRGGQIAGFSGAILALVGANSVPALDSLSGAARGGAGVSLMVGAVSLVLSLVIALRASLLPGWVHVRTIRAMRSTIDEFVRQGNRVEKATRSAEYFFWWGFFQLGFRSLR